MKKAKKTAAKKAVSKAKKSVAPKAVKARAKSKAKIQVKAKAKSPVKRKAARKSRSTSPDDLLLQSITTHEERRGVIPTSAEGNHWETVAQVARPKKVQSRKVLAKKKPVFSVAHSK